MNTQNLENAIRHCDYIFKARHSVYNQDFSRVLILNLNDEIIETADLPQSWISSYVSGPCLGARIWAQFCDNNDDSPIVITVPAARQGSIVSIAFKSPTSQRLVFNTINGSFAQKITNCRFAAIIIRGRLKNQGVIELNAGGAKFNIGSAFRKMGTSELVKKLCHDEYISCLAVGKAGENGVSYASCICEGLSTGRFGLGCVLGNKNIKAITVTAVSEKTDRNNNDGTSLVRIADYRGWAPVKNFTKRTDPRLFHISESEFQRLYSKKNRVSPPSEDIMMLGSNTGCFDLEKILVRYDICTDLGLDPIAVGSILGANLKGDENNEKVCSIIREMADNTKEYSYSKLGDQPCGPYDYRGNYVQAISDMNGNWFPVIFNCNALLGTSQYDFWADLAEDLTMGLESFGLDPQCIVRRVKNVDISKALLFKHSVKSADRYFSPEEQAEVLSKQFKTNLVGQDIINLGRTCRRIIWEINQALGAPQIRIPDYFMTNPDSAYDKAQIVPVFALMQAYEKRRNRLFAMQDSVPSGK